MNAYHFLTIHPVAVLAVTIMLGQAGMPIASAPMLLLLGALTGSEKVGIPLALCVTVSSCVFVDCAWFDFGRNRKLHPGRVFERLQSADSRSLRIAHLFARHGAVAILAARFLPGPNLAAAIAGLSGVSKMRFMLLDIIASGLWAMLYLAAGRFLPQHLRLWVSSAISNSPVCAIILILGFAGAVCVVPRFGRYLPRRLASRFGEPDSGASGAAVVDPCLNPDV